MFIEDDLLEMDKEMARLEKVGFCGQSNFSASDDIRVNRLSVLYLLRMLAGVHAFEKFYSCWDESSAAFDEATAKQFAALGLPLPREGMSERERGHLKGKAKFGCRKHCAELESELALNPPFAQSLEAFGDHLHLDTVERGVLAFASILHGEDWFEALCSNTFGQVNDKQGYTLLGHALGFAFGAIETALAPAGKLTQAGLVKWDRMGCYTLDSKLECARGLPNVIMSEGCGPMGFLEKQCRLAPAPTTTLADFAYLEKDALLLKRLLTQSLQRGSTGVNILLYGPPGTGKTELVRALSSAVSCGLWEVGCQDETGNSVEHAERLNNFRVGQAMLRGRDDALLVFDETEDVFPDNINPFFGIHDRSEVKTKAWFNQLLENNPVPTIWVSNSPQGIDNAYMRRFLYVLEIPQPPRQVRLNMLEKQLSPAGVPKSWLERISVDERLVPGHIERARRLIEHLGKLSPEEAQHVAEQAFVNTLRATGESGTLKGGEPELTRYRPEFLNAGTDLAALAEGIAARGAGRLCLYGPPGTGKSAFARHLVERAGKPLIYRRASDLVSCWVGETEKLIAKMFEDAHREGAAVLLDEADSFLTSRESAMRSWEVSQVNELLTQMEAFQGLFIASTNLMERLDFAVLRRFDLKVRFNYMQPEQSRALLTQVLEEHEIVPKKTDAKLIEHVGSLSNLTPGDFAAVIRQARLASNATTVNWWIDALERECNIKPDAPRSTLGFLT